MQFEACKYLLLVSGFLWCIQSHSTVNWNGARTSHCTYLHLATKTDWRKKNSDSFSTEYYVTFVRKFLNPRRVVNLTSKHRHAEGYNIIDIIHIISQLYYYLSHLLYSLLFILQQRDGILLIDYSTFICLGIIIIKVQAVLHAQLQYIQKSNTIFRSSTSILLSEYIISVGSQSVNNRKASVVQYSITKNYKLSFQVCSVLIFFFFLNLHRSGFIGCYGRKKINYISCYSILYYYRTTIFFYVTAAVIKHVNEILLDRFITT